MRNIISRMNALPDLIFMGTPDFARICLEHLLRDGFPVKAVVTQPDKPQGRRNRILPPPVKTLALEHGIPVLQPENLPDMQTELERLKPAFVAVVAYGQILDRAALCIPCRMCASGAHHACINVHASLLPAYRGASPIQSAIMNGDKTTGVTTMLMEPGMDTGPILLRDPVPIDDADTFETLHDKLAQAGAALLARTLREFDSIKPQPQDHGKATFTEKITKQHGRIDWSRPAEQIRNLVRACTPWPAAYTYHNKSRIIVWETRVLPDIEPVFKPGTIVGVDASAGIVVATGRGRLAIRALQREGGKRQAFDSFLRGFPLVTGTIFSGNPPELNAGFQGLKTNLPS